MARLPQPGGDSGNWGAILNDFLAQAHTSDGALKPGVVTSTVLAQNAVSVAQVADGAITESKLAAAVQTKLNAVGGTAGVSSVNTRTGDVTLTKTDVGLANVDNTSDAAKPISTATQTALNGKANSTHSHAIGDLSDVTTSGATDGQSLVFTGGTWGPAMVSAGGASVVDATSTAKGVVQLAGDLGGTAAAPTVPELANKANTSDVYTRTQADTRYVRTVNGTAPDGTGNVTVSAGTSGVSSVNTRTGDVTLTKTDVGLANVDNTSDANKPVSTATQTALNGKANTTHTHAAADITSGTIASARLGSGTADATTVLYGDGSWKAAPTGGGSSSMNIRHVTTSGVTEAADNDWMIVNPASGAVNIALPAPSPNAHVRVKRNAPSGNSIVIVTPNGGTLDGGEFTMATLNAGWSSMDYESDGTNWFTV